MEVAKEVGGDSDVVGCGGRVDGDYGHDLFIVSQLVRDLVLPDGPAARGAATSWRVYLSGRDDLWLRLCSCSIEVWNGLIFW